MAKVTLKGNPFNTNGELPQTNTVAKDFKLTATDLSTKTLEDYKGNFIVLNIFPSIDTPTCASSVRQFNKELNELENTKVLCISKDLPFAQSRFCAAEGLENVINLSDFKDGQFGKDYGVTLTDGPLEQLHARAVVIINPENKIIYNELVSEIADAPNYKAALEAIK